MRYVRWSVVTLLVFLTVTAGAGVFAQELDELGLPMVPGRTVHIERMGTVNRIDGHGMVVDDVWVGFSAQTRFFSRRNRPIGWNRLEVGDKVGFAMAKDGVTASAVWQLP